MSSLILPTHKKRTAAFYCNSSIFFQMKSSIETGTPITEQVRDRLSTGSLSNERSPWQISSGIAAHNICKCTWTFQSPHTAHDLHRPPVSHSEHAPVQKPKENRFRNIYSRTWRTYQKVKSFFLFSKRPRNCGIFGFLSIQSKSTSYRQCNRTQYTSNYFQLVIFIFRIFHVNLVRDFFHFL